MCNCNMKPKILFIMHMPPPVHGAAMMGKYIHDSKIVNGAFECRYINPATAASLEDIGKVGVRKLRDFYSLLKRIRRSVKEFAPDLVYFTANACGGAFYKDFVIVELLKRMGCRIVVHYHNKGVSTRQDRWLDDCLYRRFFKGLKVILLAEALYKDVQKYVKREDVEICPNGIPESLDYEPKAERNNVVPHILFLSNLIESKGVFVLLDALKILKERGYSFVCDFVGGETAEIDAARFSHEVEQRGLSEVAIYHGRKYGEEKRVYFEKADIFAFPSYYHNETFGLVNLEAMEHKLPVVSTNEGGIPDVVKDGINGLIVDAKSGEVAADELAERLAQLIDNPALREQMGEEGYKMFKEQFTLDRFELAIKDALRKAAGGGNKAVVRYLGPQYGDAKYAILKSSDMLVFPTCYPNECFPLVLLEAMQCGVACISTNEAAIPEIVDDGRTGLVVDKGAGGIPSAEDVSVAIEQLITNRQLCCQMGQEGRKKFEEEYSLDIFEQNITNCIKACL